MAHYPVKKILLEPDAADYGLAGSILKKLPHIPIFPVSASDEMLENETDMGKTSLQLLNFKGSFLKPCPGTREYICCGYQILNVAGNCPLDCSYCILQAYMNQPNLRVFVNLEQELKLVLEKIDQNPDEIFRIGTGEFTDSLAMDDVTDFARLLVPAFTTRKNAILELKTKSVQVEGLLSMKHRDRIIVSWSLNSPYIANHEEHGAPSIKKRLATAQRCQKEGFVIGFHFDPLIFHTGWQDAYMETIEMMDKYIDPKGIIWISLGAFRYMPSLKPIIRKRHSRTCVLNGEFIQGLDGKMRYFKPIRLELFEFMRKNLEKWYPSLGIYLCMESDDIWDHSLGWSPKNSEGLRRFLDDRVKKFFSW